MHFWFLSELIRFFSQNNIYSNEYNDPSYLCNVQFPQHSQNFALWSSLGEE